MQELLQPRSTFVAACTPVSPGATGGEQTGTGATGSTEPVTLAFWNGWGGSTVEALQKCGDKFSERNPGIKINVVGAT